MQINQNNYNTKRGFLVIPFTAKIQIWILFTVCHFFIIWPWEFGIKLNNIHKLMLFCILDTFLKDNVLILEGEITNWSLLGVKELENAAKMIVGSSCLICVYNTFVVLSCYTIHVKWRTETSVHSYPCNFFFFFTYVPIFSWIKICTSCRIHLLLTQSLYTPGFGGLLLPSVRITIYLFNFTNKAINVVQ